MLQATFLYRGLPDYWGGVSRRWDDDAGCLFTSYDNRTTVREVIEGLVSDYVNGGDCDSFVDVSADDVRACLLSMLTADGLRDYHSGALYEGASEVSEDDADNYELPAVIVLLEVE